MLTDDVRKYNQKVWNDEVMCVHYVQICWWVSKWTGVKQDSVSVSVENQIKQLL